MVLGDKVVAAVKPAEEGKKLDPKNVNIFDEFLEEKEEEEKEENEQDLESCMCFCFCEDEDETSLKKDERSITISDPDKREKSQDTSDDEEEEEEKELVDPHDELRNQCGQKKECEAIKSKLAECNARVESRSKTTETCVEELLDFMHCVDHCASKTLFSKLK